MKHLGWLLAVVACGSPAEPVEPVTVAVSPAPSTEIDDAESAEPEPPRPAPPKPPPKEDVAGAREAFNRGMVAFKEQRYEEARKAFVEAYLLAPRPAVLFNVVTAAQKEGNEAVACLYYEELEEHATESPEAQRAFERLSNPCTK